MFGQSCKSRCFVVTAGWHVPKSAQRLDMPCAHFFQFSNLHAQPTLSFLCCILPPTHAYSLSPHIALSCATGREGKACLNCGTIETKNLSIQCKQIDKQTSKQHTTMCMHEYVQKGNSDALVPHPTSFLSVSASIPVTHTSFHSSSLFPVKKHTYQETWMKTHLLKAQVWESSAVKARTCLIDDGTGERRRAQLCCPELAGGSVDEVAWLKDPKRSPRPSSIRHSLTVPPRKTRGDSGVAWMPWSILPILRSFPVTFEGWCKMTVAASPSGSG